MSAINPLERPMAVSLPIYTHTHNDHILVDIHMSKERM